MTTRTDRELAIRINQLLPHTQFTANNMRDLMVEAIQHFRSDFDPRNRSNDYLRGACENLLDVHDQLTSGGRVDEDHPLVKQIHENRRKLAGVR